MGYLAPVLRVVSKSPAAQAFAAALDAPGPLPPVPDDLSLVLGGDGTMLQAIHERAHGRTWLGLNFGHLGFLMNDLPAQGGVEYVRDRLATHDWQSHNFMRLSMRAEAGEREVAGLAVNDVYVERQSGTACHLKVSVDGHVVAERLVCDGIIAATPLGSTAYSFSAGGSAGHPLVRSVHLTAICPHAPKLPPLVLPATARIRVDVLDAKRRPARVVLDGIAHGDVRYVEIGSSPDDDVALAFFAGHDFTRTLLRKLVRR